VTPEAVVLRAGAAALVAFPTGLLLIPVMIALARRLNFVAAPRKDRWGSRPTALMGGVAIYAAASLAVFAAVPDFRPLAGLYLAGTAMFVVGLIDDIFTLGPHYKLLAQVVAACILVAFGVHFAFAGHPLFSIALTLLFVVGITNAINLLDNMDGLAAGVSAIAAIVIAAGAFQTGNAPGAVGASAIAGAALAFLAFNFHPAKVFMGDCGSMFLGLALAVLAIQTSASTSTNLAGAVLFPCMALAIPIFDTCFVTVMRRAHGRAISQGGCDHSSHRLVKLGLSEPQAVVLLYGATLLVGLMGIAAMRYDAPYLMAAGVLAAAWMLVLGKFLAQAEVYAAESSGTGHAGGGQTPVVLFAGRMYKKQTATALIDMLLAFAASIITGLICFRGGAGEVEFSAGIPWMVAISAGTLAAAGVYRGVWRHLMPVQAIRIAAGSAAAGTGSAAVTLLMGNPPAAAASCGAVYGLLLIGLLIGTRGMYLAMNRVLRKRPTGRWLIVAPNNLPSEEVLGLVRDSGRSEPPSGIVTLGVAPWSEIAGIANLGPLEALERIVADLDPAAILVAGRETPARVAETCRMRGMDCHVADLAGGHH